MDNETIKKLLLSLNAGLGAYDWNETRAHVTGETGKENNPLLGSKPSPAAINSYFTGMGAAELGALKAAPEEWKTPLLGLTALVELLNLNGQTFGGGHKDMWNAKDKNSVPIALGTSALTYALGASLLNDSPNIGVGNIDGTPTLSLTKKF